MTQANLPAQALERRELTRSARATLGRLPAVLRTGEIVIACKNNRVHAMGAPPIPAGIPKDRLKFVDMRVNEAAQVDGLEDEMEWYYTDTGETIPDADDTPDDIAERTKNT